MIRVICKLTVQKRKIESFIKMVSPGVAERKEEGQLAYNLVQDVNEENVFLFVEEWESQEALQKHMDSTKGGANAIDQMLEKPAEFRICKTIF